MRDSISPGAIKSISASPNRALSGPAICPASGATSFFWQNAYVLNLPTPLKTTWTGYDPGNPPFYFGTTTTQDVFGLGGAFANNWTTTQYPYGGTNYPPNKPYGRWKITVTVSIYRKKIPTDRTGEPARDWLFINLTRQKNDYNAAPDLVRKVNGKTVISNGIPSSSVPVSSSNPLNFPSTWAFDLTNPKISPTPSNPYVFTDYIVVPEVLDVCYVFFNSQYYFWDDMANIIGSVRGFSTRTNVQPYPSPTPGCPFVQYGLDPLGQYGARNPSRDFPPPLANDWDLPMPNILAGGAVAVNQSLTAQQLDAYLKTIDPNYNAPYPLWTARFDVERIPDLIALFTWSLTSGRSVKFADVSLGGPVGWDWDFADGSAHATTQNPTHTFPGAGSYPVKLTATNSIGETSSLVQTVIIPLIAKFSWAFVGISSGLYSIQFTDQSTGAATWDWDFGDGSAHSTVQNAFHKYARNSTFTVTLKVGDGTGKFATYSAVVVTA